MAEADKILANTEVLIAEIKAKIQTIEINQEITYQRTKQ
jgi:hypothetical protein